MGNRYLFGNFSIDLTECRVWKNGELVRRPDGRPLMPKAVRILIRIIEKRPQIVRGVDVADLLDQRRDPGERNKDFQSYISLLRRSLGPGKFNKFILHLGKTADGGRGGGYKFSGEVQFVPDNALEDYGAQRQNIMESVDELAPPVSQPHSNGFTIALDSMVLNSFAELIRRDDETAAIRRRGRASYERCLEDVAFALVYGSKIVTSKDFRPSLTRPNQPGRDLIGRLGEVWGHHALDEDLKDGALLADRSSCERIKADIRCFAYCLLDTKTIHFFRDYLMREAHIHLGTDSSLFQEGLSSERYEFNVGRPYYRNRRLQDAIGQKAIDQLVSFLPKCPERSRDSYATSALREFATRNVLTLITIMHETEESAKRNGMWVMPHVVRSLVKQRSIDSLFIEQQRLLRNIAVRHALVAAFRKAKGIKGDAFIGVLMDLRDDQPFKQVRDILERENLLLLEPSRVQEEKAQKVLQFINGYAGSEETDRFLLARQSALREMQSISPSEYKLEMYRIFPELNPTVNGC